MLSLVPGLPAGGLRVGLEDSPRERSRGPIHRALELLDRLLQSGDPLLERATSGATLSTFGHARSSSTYAARFSPGKRMHAARPDMDWNQSFGPLPDAGDYGTQRQFLLWRL